MTSLTLGKPHLLAALGLAFVVHVLLFAPAGFLTTDEFLYAAAVDRLIGSGSLYFDNGPADAAARGLNLLFLTPTPKGLTPQYPPGYAALAAPFFALGHIRGMMFLNALAALGMIFMTYRLALLLFEDRARALNAALILGLSTFIADYAFAVLPHATAGLCVVAAVYCAAASVRGAGRRDLMAVLAGLAIGLGIQLRVDVILIAPLLAAWLIGASGAPARRLAALGIGLVPGLVAASWMNFERFGSLSPITYGRDSLSSASDLSSLAAYQGIAPVVLLGLVGVGAFGFTRVRAQFIGWKGVALLALGLAAVLAVPATQGFVLRILKGLYVLLVDLQSYDHVERLSGHSRRVEGGWLVFSGGVKKALFESLPYAGFLALPLAGIFQGRRRAEITLLAVIPLGWFTFFALNQWHGGQSNNMRYFTPMLPFIAILAADAWHRLGIGDRQRPPLGRRGRILLATVAAAAILAGISGPDHLAFAFLVGLGKGVFLAGLCMAFAILALPRASWLRPAARGLFLTGLLVAFMSAYLHDVRISHIKRAWYLDQRVGCARIEANALVVSHLPRLYYCHFLRQGGSLAVYHLKGRSLGRDLIGRALAASRPVYTDPDTAHRMEEDGIAQRYDFRPVPESGGTLIRIGPKAAR